ncbi:hypothetical protein V5799_011933 [Amblyomma americanum]|uniref:THAP-type domain-containing protein n=1 Tax=Amblyomma americanum TaxID=6943 RepID=A0AAQ4EFP9_AMBAM
MSPTQLYATYRICGDHFTADNFTDPGMTSLKTTAIPTVQPTGYWDCQLAKGCQVTWGGEVSPPFFVWIEKRTAGSVANTDRCFLHCHSTQPCRRSVPDS